MTRNLKTCFAIALLSVVTATVQAGTFTLTPTVVEAYNELGETIPVPPLDQNYGSPITLKVQVTMSVVALGAGERSFGNTGFNINFGGGAIADLANFGGWEADTRTGDSNGAAGGGIVPMWFANADAGPSSDDFQGIFVTIANGLNGPNDNRRNIGQVPGSQGPVTGTNPYPTGQLGNFYVLWDGVGSPYNGPDADYFEIADILFQSTDAAGTFGGDTSGATIRVFLGQDVPEPGTLALAGLSLVGLVLRRAA